MYFAEIFCNNCVIWLKLNADLDNLLEYPCSEIMGNKILYVNCLKMSAS